jgi:hypothetical protein
MATFLQLIGMLIGVGILLFLAFKLMSHEQIIRRSAAKVDKMIGDTFEAVSKRLDSNNRLERGNSDLLLMIEDLKREISEREL